MMNKSLLYISDTGLVLLLVVYLPLCLIALWLIGRLLRSLGCSLKARRWVRWPLALAMLLWPTWDAILGKYYLDRYCEKGGLSVNPEKKISSLYFPTEGNDEMATMYLSMGFQFIEANDEGGKYRQYQLGRNGELISRIVEKRKSSFIREYDFSQARMKPEYLGIKMNRHFIKRIIDDEIIAEYRDFYFQSRLDKNITILDVNPGVRCSELKKYRGTRGYSNSMSMYSRIAGQER